MVACAGPVGAQEVFPEGPPVHDPAIAFILASPTQSDTVSASVYTAHMAPLERAERYLPPNVPRRAHREAVWDFLYLPLSARVARASGLRPQADGVAAVWQRANDGRRFPALGQQSRAQGWTAFRLRRHYENVNLYLQLARLRGESSTASEAERAVYRTRERAEWGQAIQREAIRLRRNPAYLPQPIPMR